MEETLKTIILKDIKYLLNKINTVMVESRLITNSLEGIQFMLTNEDHTLNVEDLEEDNDIISKEDLEVRRELANDHDFIVCDIDMKEIADNKNWVDICCDNLEKDSE